LVILRVNLAVKATVVTKTLLKVYFKMTTTLMLSTEVLLPKGVWVFIVSTVMTGIESITAELMSFLLRADALADNLT